MAAASSLPFRRAQPCRQGRGGGLTFGASRSIRVGLWVPFVRKLARLRKSLCGICRTTALYLRRLSTIAACSPIVDICCPLRLASTKNYFSQACCLGLGGCRCSTACRLRFRPAPWHILPERGLSIPPPSLPPLVGPSLTPRLLT